MIISFINFWPLNEKIDYWLYYFCVSIFDEEVKIVSAETDGIDILFCSCFGSIDNVKAKKAKIKIFFTGENVERPEYSIYSNEKVMNEVFDLRLGFHYTDLKNNKIRLPLWITFYNYYSMENEKDNFISNLLQQRLKNIGNETKFGTLVCSHDRNGIRGKILDELSKYGKIECGGKYRNNGTIIGNKWEDKLNYIKDSKYTICPENSSAVGYCTEKIMHGIEGGCIPLYWGNDYPEKNILKKESYIFVNVENEKLMNKQISEGLKKEIVLDVFTRESKYVLDNYYKTLEWGIKLKLNKVDTQRIYGISYASRHFINRENKIKEEALKSGYFDEFRCCTEKDIDESFIKNMGNVWNMSKGGGYWVWKPYIIYEKLKTMKDNDILVYIDSGCTINNGINARKRFNEYIEMVNNHWTGFLRFQLGENCKEEWYNNKYFINYFENRYDVDTKEYLKDRQLLNTVLIIRKTSFVMKFFEEHLRILYDNPIIHTDVHTLPNEKHRHDQSVGSLLYKYMNGDLIINDETWFSGTGGNGDFGKAKSLNYPIWATRLRF
jgi:hypothetical protein